MRSEGRAVAIEEQEKEEEKAVKKISNKFKSVSRELRAATSGLAVVLAASQAAILILSVVVIPTNQPTSFHSLTTMN